MKKDTNRTMIEDNWWLLKFFAAKCPRYVTIFMVPIVGFWTYMASQFQMSLGYRALYFGYGLLLWSFMEYCIHRFVFHLKIKKQGTFKRFIESFHIYHHRNPEDQRVYTSGVVSAIFWMLFMGGTLSLITNMAAISHILLGVGVYYYFYEWVHHLVHVKSYNGGFMGFLQDTHFHHHKVPHCNYGQTTILWDLVFGTYQTSKNWKRAQNKEKFVIEFQR